MADSSSQFVLVSRPPSTPLNYSPSYSPVPVNYSPIPAGYSPYADFPRPPAPPARPAAAPASNVAPISSISLENLKPISSAGFGQSSTTISNLIPYSPTTVPQGIVASQQAGIAFSALALPEYGTQSIGISKEGYLTPVRETQISSLFEKYPERLQTTQAGVAFEKAALTFPLAAGGAAAGPAIGAGLTLVSVAPTVFTAGGAIGKSLAVGSATPLIAFGSEFVKKLDVTDIGYVAGGLAGGGFALKALAPEIGITTGEGRIFQPKNLVDLVRTGKPAATAFEYDTKYLLPKTGIGAELKTTGSSVVQTAFSDLSVASARAGAESSLTIIKERPDLATLLGGDVKVKQVISKDLFTEAEAGTIRTSDVNQMLGTYNIVAKGSQPSDFLIVNPSLPLRNELIAYSIGKGPTATAGILEDVSLKEDYKATIGGRFGIFDVEGTTTSTFAGVSGAGKTGTGEIGKIETFFTKPSAADVEMTRSILPDKTNKELIIGIFGSEPKASLEAKPLTAPEAATKGAAIENIKIAQSAGKDILAKELTSRTMPFIISVGSSRSLSREITPFTVIRQVETPQSIQSESLMGRIQRTSDLVGQLDKSTERIDTISDQILSGRTLDRQGQIIAPLQTPSERELQSPFQITQQDQLQIQIPTEVTRTKTGPAVSVPGLKIPTDFAFPSFGIPKLGFGKKSLGKSSESEFKLPKAYTPSVYGLLSGKSIPRVPKFYTGEQVRYPVGRNIFKGLERSFGFGRGRARKKRRR